MTTSGRFAGLDAAEAGTGARLAGKHAAAARPRSSSPAEQPPDYIAPFTFAYISFGQVAKEPSGASSGIEPRLSA